MTEIIQVKKIRGVPTGPFALNFNVEQMIGEIQHYSCESMFSDERKHGVVINDIHILFPENQIGFILPFTEEEKICWECGAHRMLEFNFDLKCGCMTWVDWCYNPTHERKKKKEDQ